MRTLQRVVVLLCVAVASLPAQGEPRSIAGRVLLPGGRDGTPVAGAWVTLHRVGPDAAGPVDSLRTSRDGRYEFRYQATGDTSAIYFVSTSRGGVAYFTPPVRERTVRGGIAEIAVHDTTSAPLTIRTVGRHLIITAPDSATRTTRTVVEIFELTNDSTRTRVAAGPDGFTFDAALPAGVTEVTAGPGDVSPEAIRVVDGRVRVNAPLSPGVRQVAFSYEVPANLDPLEFLIESPTALLEVLVESPSAVASGARLVADEPVQVEGRPFKRFEAKDVTAAQTITVTIPAESGAGTNRVMLIVALVGGALAIALLLALRRSLTSPHRRTRAGGAEAIALEIATLDAAFERRTAPTEAERTEYELVRRQLRDRLDDVLANERT
ncbi:MAG: hypothetical protein RL625_1455 [Gemmatimonadota bacterium]